MPEPSQQEAIAKAMRQLMERGCTEHEADHVVTLLLGTGVLSTQLDRWIDDLWALVEAAFDAVFDE